MARWPCPVLKYRHRPRQHGVTAVPGAGGWQGLGDSDQPWCETCARPSLGLGQVMAVGAQRHSEASGLSATTSAKCPARPLLGCPARGPGCCGDLHSSGLVQPLLWLSPWLGQGCAAAPCSCPCSPAGTQTQRVPRCGRAGARAVVAAGSCLESVPPGWKPLVLLVTRGTSPVPWPASAQELGAPGGPLACRWLVLVAQLAGTAWSLWPALG